MTTRRKNDKYDTPYAPQIIAPLVKFLGDSLRGTVIEPCAGDGNLASAITNKCPHLSKNIWTFDLIRGFDATKISDWRLMSNTLFGQADWTITNPPFNIALPIIENAWEFSKVGVAMLLPITWNEPCENRRDWLINHADNLLTIMPVSPRIPFRKGEINPKTGKPYGTDARTVCWYVWRKDWSWKKRGIPCPFQYLAGWKG